ncbi:MAG: helix-turn-helix domain-containing protein [Actinobacteria bacterium]|nr:helix-turn-helix domain-containing protein [Actinomycetota bacterium]
MTDVTPIDPEAWEHDGRIVPIEGAREFSDWLDGIKGENADWDDAVGGRAPWGEGYAVVVAVKSPGPRNDRGVPTTPDGTIRYFMVTGDDVRLLALNASERVGRVARRLGTLLGPAVAPIAGRFKDALKEAFVNIEQVAEITGVDRVTVERWAREHDDFPLSVAERPRGPVYVRDEIMEWVERNPAPPSVPPGR